MSITREVIGAKIWGSGGSDPGDRTEPDSADIISGWAEGKPERQYFNWLDFVQHNNLAFFEQAGFYKWETSITYETFAIVRAKDGVLYLSIVDDNIANDPSGGADTTNWENFGSWLNRNSASSSYIKVIDSSSAEATAGSVTIPAGVYDIHCIGAGGGGGGGSGEDDYDGHGGGGGACVYERKTITIATTFSLSLGAGGLGGTPYVAGGTGGTTTFSTLSAVGGGGGDYGNTGGVSGVSADADEGGEGGDSTGCSGGDITWSGSSAALAYARTNSTNCVASYGGAAGGPMGGSLGGSGNYSYKRGDTEEGNAPQYGAGGRGGNYGDSGIDGADGVIFIIGV